MSRNFYLVSYVLGSIAGFFSFTAFGGFVAAEEPEAASFLPIMLGSAAHAYAWIVWYVFIYKIWARLPAAYARTTPGKALGFLFIPFFNFYWAFMAYWGWAKDYNAMADTLGLDVRRMPAGAVLAMCIVYIAGIPLAFIPFMNIIVFLVSLLLTAVFINSACNAANALAGVPVEQLPHDQTADAMEVPPEERQTCGMATASLLLGVLGLFTLITAIPGLILGIVSLGKIGRSRGRLEGTGLAVSGIAVSGIALVMMPMMLAILAPALSRVRIHAQQIVCGTNLKYLGLAMVGYAHNNDGMLPEGDNWCDVLMAEADVSYKAFLCPSDDAVEGQSSYAMNRYAAGRRRSELPGDMVLVFESNAVSESGQRWNQVGGPELLTTANHWDRGCNIFFVNGSMLFVSADEIDELRWDSP